MSDPQAGRAPAAPGAVRQGLRLLQLGSPALPIGAYSYSSGLETGIDDGSVHDAATAARWIGDVIELALARFDGPVIVAAHAAALVGDESALAELHQLAWAARETAELRLESEQMGYSLDQWIRAVLDETTASAMPGPVAATAVPGARPRLAAPVAWGIAGARLGLSAAETVAASLWGFAENQVMVLLKALPMGQIAGQRLLHALLPAVEAAVTESLRRPRAEWSSSAPGLALASMQHEVQYSRLFRS